ncbi:MAG TPA: histidinol-phosphate transaminase [Anaerolineae bacterium]|nr:histidinol-phosphate transaminase [Anaerolineae bacterium]
MIPIDQLARQCILKGKEYVPGKPVEEVKRELGLENIIKMASNENPLGTSPAALVAMINELRLNANRYPESLCHDLRHKLAGIHGLHPDQLFFGNGADGVITMIGLTFIDPGDEGIFGELTFPAYDSIVTKMDGIGVAVPLTPDCRLDINGFVAALTPRSKVIFLCNPNNPTGTIVTKDEFDRLLGATPETVLIVVDEAYFEFADDAAYPDSVAHLDEHPNLIVLRTFSKIAGLAGLRIGYAMAQAGVVKLMLKVTEPYPVNRIAQAGALAALDDVDFVSRTLEVNRKGREQFYQAFDRLGLQYYPTQTNFILVNLQRPAHPVFQAMLRDGVIIRPLTFVGAPTCIRITIGLEPENERAIHSLERALRRIEGPA